MACYSFATICRLPEHLSFNFLENYLFVSYVANTEVFPLPSNSAFIGNRPVQLEIVYIFVASTSLYLAQTVHQGLLIVNK